MNRRLLAVVAAAILVSWAAVVPVRTQPSLTITGVIRDENGAALRGATVEARANGRIYSAVTDVEGRFSIAVPSAGDYQIFASSGFLMDSGHVTALAGQTNTIDLRLTLRQPPPPPSPCGDGKADCAGTRESHANITVFFATDRGKQGTQPLPYGPDRQSDGSLHFGQVDVHVPREHRIGYVERPSIWTFWREDPNKVFVITRFLEQPAQGFFRELRTFVTKTNGKQAFIFVHGFNVSFEAAVYRTAQLAYDLDFDGAPILYSWPSEGKLTGYPTDLNNNDWTVDHLRTFLEQVSAQSGAQTIHLIAHSMGNRALANALAQMAGNSRPKRPHFNQLVLTAPDIDASIFRGLATRFEALVARATLYASSKDEALVASKEYQSYQRAGDTEPAVVIVPGMDTIDVSSVDSNLIGHFYYGDNRSVISDMKYLLEGLSPAMRATLQLMRSPGGNYWAFRR